MRRAVCLGPGFLFLFFVLLLLLFLRYCTKTINQYKQAFCCCCCRVVVVVVYAKAYNQSRDRVVVVVDVVLLLLLFPILAQKHTNNQANRRGADAHSCESGKIDQGTGERVISSGSGREVRISSDALGILLSSREPRATEEGCFPFSRGAWFPFCTGEGCFPSSCVARSAGERLLSFPTWAVVSFMLRAALRGVGVCIVTRCVHAGPVWSSGGGGTYIVRCSGCTIFPTWVAVYGGGLLSLLSWGVGSFCGVSPWCCVSKYEYVSVSAGRAGTFFLFSIFCTSNLLSFVVV